LGEETVLEKNPGTAFDLRRRLVRGAVVFFVLTANRPGADCS
jgi:hypothetical protein